MASRWAACRIGVRLVLVVGALRLAQQGCDPAEISVIQVADAIRGHRHRAATGPRLPRRHRAKAQVVGLMDPGRPADLPVSRHARSLPLDVIAGYACRGPCSPSLSRRSGDVPGDLDLGDSMTDALRRFRGDSVGRHDAAGARRRLGVSGCGPAAPGDALHARHLRPPAARPLPPARPRSRCYAADRSIPFGTGVEVSFAAHRGRCRPAAPRSTASVSSGPTVVQRRVAIATDGTGSVALDAARLTPGPHVVTVVFPGDTAFMPLRGGTHRGHGGGRGEHGGVDGEPTRHRGHLRGHRGADVDRRPGRGQRRLHHRRRSASARCRWRTVWRRWRSRSASGSATIRWTLCSPRRSPPRCRAPAPAPA